MLSLGFGGSYVRYYILYRKEKADDKIARLNGLFLIVFSVIGLIALACGLYLTFHLEMVFKTGLTDAEYHTARILMLLLTANLAVSFPMSVFSNIISAQEQFVFLKATEILRTVVSPLVTLPVLLAGYGSIGMVVVTVTISVFVDVLRLIYCFGKLHIRASFRNFDGAVLKDIAVFSGFIAINMVVDQVNNNLDKLIIHLVFDGGVVRVHAAHPSARAGQQGRQSAPAHRAHGAVRARGAHPVSDPVARVHGHHLLRQAVYLFLGRTGL